jgi:hypothetical protein
MIDWIRAAHDLGVPDAIALMFMAGLAWIGVRLFGPTNGILTRLGYKGEIFFERYIGLADKIEPAIEKQTNTSEKMLELHRDAAAPCNTLPLRRAGMAAADALDVIGSAVHADVAGHVAAIKTALAPAVEEPANRGAAPQQRGESRV